MVTKVFSSNQRLSIMPSLQLCQLIIIRFVALEKLVGFYKLLINYQIITTSLLAMIRKLQTNCSQYVVTFALDYIFQFLNV